MKNIKQVAHDLSPMCDIIDELSAVMNELLGKLAPHVRSDNTDIHQYLSDTVDASSHLNQSISLIKAYILELHAEADHHGLTKDE